MGPNLAAVDPQTSTFSRFHQDYRVLIAHSLGALSTVPNTLISLTTPETLLMLKPSIELIHEQVNTLGRLCGVHIPQHPLRWPQKDDDPCQVVRKRKKREESADVDSICLSDDSDEADVGIQQIRSEPRLHSFPTPAKSSHPHPALNNPEPIAKANPARSAQERLLQPPTIPPSSCPPLVSDCPVTATKTVHWAPLPHSPSAFPLSAKAQIRSIRAGSAPDRSNCSATSRIDLTPPTVGPAFKIDHPSFQYPVRTQAEKQINGSGAWSTE